ncbi:MAG: alcohol dehydrogenase catalytic domain-containing protein [Chloroflexi bacterium]|nr:alcohol dehydrogenase catalytic domain-containing protein [Chloroflexota bacterium]
MKAIVLREFGPPGNLKLEEVEKPRPGQDEVLVKVAACGVCGHDLINRTGMFPRTKPPVILGHEIAGVVEAVGSAVKDLAPGDRVATMQRSACGMCQYCVSGEEGICEVSSGFFGETIPGGYAEYMVAAPRSVVKLPQEIPFEQGAILACAVGTTYHAVKRRVKVQVGENVLITGAAGGLGGHFIQVVKLSGGRVIAVTDRESDREILQSRGADEIIVSPKLDFARPVREVTNGRGVDVAIEILGSVTFSSTLRSLALAGRLLWVGNVMAEQVTFPPALLILRGLTFYGTAACSRQDLVEVIELVRQGRLKPVVARTLPLADAPMAHQLMIDRAVSGRVVLTI